MTKLQVKLFLNIVFLIFYLSGTNADTIVEFRYSGFDFRIDTRSEGFFTGNITVKEKGNTVFSMDSTFTSYVDHKFIDLDKNGKKELALYLTDGASPYVFHYLYIFDGEKGPKPLFMLLNGEIDSTDKELPLLTVNSRMSPAVLGLWYNWYLQYKNGRLSYFNPDKKRKQSVRPEYEFVNEALKDLKENNQTCDDFAYDVFFEYIFLCSKIAGEENEAEEYFNKNYLCPEKTAALKRFKNYAADNLKWIKDEENYIYSEY